MSWARVDDGLFEHPKFADLSDRAKLLYIASLVYGNKHLTGGIIPPSGLRITKAWARATNKHVAELVLSRLWELVMEGHIVHDWDDYNIPAVKVKAQRQAAKERMARLRLGERSGEQTTLVQQPPSHTPTPTPSPSHTPNSGGSNSQSGDTGKDKYDDCIPLGETS